MFKLALLLVVASVLFIPDRNLVIEDRCDYIEFNDFILSGQGEVYARQVVFWEWKDRGVAHIQRDSIGNPTGLVRYGGGFVVIDYRMMKTEKYPSGVDAVKSYRGKKGVELVFWDTSDKVIRRVRAKWFSYSKGEDTEQRNLKVFAAEHRRRLFEPK